MKKWFVIITLSVMMMFVFGIEDVHAKTKDGTSGNIEEFQTIECYYPVSYSQSPDSGNFIYGDFMLFDSSNATEMNPDLAKASVYMAMSAYDQGYLQSCISQMGFEVLSRSEYYEKETTYTDNDHVAYMIANKRIQYQGEFYDIYLVPVRGTPQSCEWYSNFNVGRGDKHQGFYAAAEEIIEDLKRHDDSGFDAAHTIIWTMGHSRGAAVANIVAGELTQSGLLASPENIFGYTYACPNVSRTANIDFKNIYNFNNPGDPVTALPLEAWGFTRFGQNIDMDSEDYENLKLKYLWNTNTEYTVSRSVESFEDAFRDLAPSQSDFNSLEVRTLVEVAAWFLGGKQDATVPLSFLMLSNPQISGLMQLSLLKLGVEATVQTMFSTLFYDLEEITIFLGELDEAIVETAEMDENEWEMWKNEHSSITWKIQNDFEIEVTSPEDLREARRIIKGQIEQTSSLTDAIEDVLYLFYDTNGNPLNSMTQGHGQQTYVWWLNAMCFGYRGWTSNENLTEVVIEQAGSSIGDYCFASCVGLETVTISDDVRFLGKGAFTNCSVLKKVTMPVDIISFCDNYSNSNDNSSFWNTTGIEEIIYTPGQTGEMQDRLGDSNYTTYTWWLTAEGQSGGSLKKVTYEEGVKKIGDYANCYCQELQTVELPTTLETIGAYAFDHTVKLELTELPESLKEIKEGGFQESAISCEWVNVEKLGKNSFAGSKIKGIEFTGENTEIAEGVCFNCSELKEIKIRDGVRSIGKTAFAECVNLKKLTMPVDIISSCDNYSGSNDNSSFWNTTGIEEIIYTPGKTGEMQDKLGDSNYTTYTWWLTAEGQSNGSLKKVTYEEGVKKIGDYANCYCQELQTVELPTTLETIGAYAFDHTVKLELTELPESLKEIKEGGFQESAISCEWVNVEKLGKNSFIRSNIKGIEFNENVTEIAEGVCSDCYELKEVKISDTVRSIGKTAFANCSALKKVTMPVDITSFCNNYSDSNDNSSFWNTTGIEEILYTLGQTGEMQDKLGDSSYTTYTWWLTAEGQSTGSLKKVAYAPGVKKIGDYANCACTNLEEVWIPETVSAIGQYAFSEGDYVIKCMKNSYAHTYALENNIAFEILEEFGCLEHTWDDDYTVDIPKSCEVDGKKSIHCSKCSATKDEMVIPANGHNVVIDKGRAESCKKDGLTEGQHCSECNEVLLKQEVIKAPGHSYKSKKTAPTCTTKGYTTYTCSCGDSYKSENVSALGHDWDNGVLTKKATEKASGVRTYTCDRCDNTKVESIAKISSVKLTDEKLVYTGKKLSAKVVVEDAKGKKLVNGTDYTLSYNSSSRKKVGRYYVTVSFHGKYTGTKKLWFTIVPKAPTTVEAELYGYDDVQITWSKSTGASGYAVYYKKSDADKYTLLNRTSDRKIKTGNKVNLSDGKKYQFKVVPYYKDSSGTRFLSTKYKTDTVYTLKKLSAPVVKKSGTKVKVTWKNISGETGYQISQSKKKAGTDAVWSKATTSGTNTKLKAAKGVKYYYKVRAYKKLADGTKVYGPWSTVSSYKR